MIEFLTEPRLDADLDALVARARRALGAGMLDDAARALGAALGVTHGKHESYVEACKLGSSIVERRGDRRSALALSWYADDAARQTALAAQLEPLDRARTLARVAALDPGRKLALLGEAALEFERSNQPIRAAICHERAGDARAARALWSRIAQSLDALPRESYAAGLAHFNLARASEQCGDARGAREATVAAVHRLEEAADRFEAVGQRERAFDCFHVLTAIGRMTRTFEHVLEGSVNMIRILGEDNLKYHVQRQYEQVLSLAEAAGEHAAAASLAREMSEYSRKHGMPRAAERGVARQAELWHAAGNALLERGAPPQLAENALLASILCHAEAGQFKKVAALYARLADLDLEPSRRAHYARAVSRYRDVGDAPAAPRDPDVKEARQPEPPDVWLDDLVEWEEQGSAAEACADVLLDPAEPADSIVRRRALVGLLVALAAAQAPPERAEQDLVTLCTELAKIELYSILPALEALYRRHQPAVRLAAVRALSACYYKRTFVTLEVAVTDADRGVAAQAATALEGLRFDHALDPLMRIHRSSPNPEARLAALRGLARIDLPETAELMLAVLDHGSDAERALVVEALGGGRAAHFDAAARLAIGHAGPRQRDNIEKVMAAREKAT